MSWVPFAVGFVVSAGYYALYSIMFEDIRKTYRETSEKISDIPRFSYSNILEEERKAYREASAKSSDIPRFSYSNMLEEERKAYREIERFRRRSSEEN